MRGPAPSLVLVILGLFIACAPAPAQDKDAPSELQTESPFAEEIKHLETAADKAARVGAFEKILAKATDLKREPEPLISVLQNKKPEDAYADLLPYIRDHEGARHKAFIQPLVLCANDAGDTAKVAGAAVRAYGLGAVPVIRDMLDGETAAERLGAANIAGERVGGTGGVAKLASHLVKALGRNEPDLSGVLIRSLKRVTLLDYDKPEQWQEWLGGKSEFDLVVEIADRENAARVKAQAEAESAQKELLDVTLQRMRNAERNDSKALIAYLRNAPQVPVRAEAAKLLREALPALDETVAKPIIEALGASLNNRDETELVRKECATALAECRKPALAFPYIDSALEANAIGADLKLELVKGLNAPIAGARVARMLKAEIDVVETRSGAVLEALIAQVRSVVEIEDSGENKQAILGEFSRLLELVAKKISGELEAPARKRYVDLATKTCDTLVHIARLRRVDVSATVDALTSLALTENGASSMAMTALREALNVPSARAGVYGKLTGEPVASRLQALYQKLVSGGEEAMLINLLGLYENMGVAPEPVEQLRKRLIDRAESTEAVLPANADARKTMRDALRGLLARLLDSADAHAALIRDLLAARYGGNDALGYLLVLPPPRIAILRSGTNDFVRDKPIDAALLVLKLDPSLNADERANRDYQTFREGLDRLVRTAISARLATALRDGFDDDSRKDITGLAGGPLRAQFVLSAVEELRKKPETGDARDTVSEVLLSSLKQAHPGKYDTLSMKGLNKEEFVKALDDLNVRLRNDGYAVP
ncbi:MAG: hypothetical protein K8I27_12920 [Planctomycetes bacterium]|nr:hypothetical protein [Planctomycetota bacterium]